MLAKETSNNIERGKTMPENRFSCGPNAGKETVCIETNRILDSCRDRDCFENVRVFLTDFGREIIERTTAVRVLDACIAWTNIAIDPVQFNRGFYSVNIRYFVKLTFEACIGGGRAQEFEGIAVLDKRVILYGGDSNVNIFRSSQSGGFCSVPEPCCGEKNVPTAVIEVVDPIVLGVKVLERKNDCCCKCCCCAYDIPETITRTLSGNIIDDEDRYLAVSLGIFSVIRIVRPAQYLINATEFCIPDKECTKPNEDDPCSVFRAMAFPTTEFCTGSFSNIANERLNGKCGCGS